MSEGGIALALEELGREEALVPLALCWVDWWEEKEEPHQAWLQVAAVDAEAPLLHLLL